MRNWCARHPLYFMGLYALFYLTFFALLERTIQTPDLWVHCRLDDLDPVLQVRDHPLFAVVSVDPVYPLFHPV